MNTATTPTKEGSEQNPANKRGAGNSPTDVNLAEATGTLDMPAGAVRSTRSSRSTTRRRTR